MARSASRCASGPAPRASTCRSTFSFVRWRRFKAGKAVGVVSGTGSDGSLGLEAIKAAGGLCFTQDPLSAGYDGMPRSAIATGCVDAVLSPEGIALEIASLAGGTYLRQPRETTAYEVPLEADKNGLEAVFVRVLYEDLLIHVTSFFRGPKTFEALRRDVFGCSPAAPPRRRSGSGCRAARPARRPIRSPSACWRASTASPPPLPSRSSVRTCARAR